MERVWAHQPHPSCSTEGDIWSPGSKGREAASASSKAAASSLSASDSLPPELECEITKSNLGPHYCHCWVVPSVLHERTDLPFQLGNVVISASHVGASLSTPLWERLRELCAHALRASQHGSDSYQDKGRNSH